jgi:hypothetical protein
MSAPLNYIPSGREVGPVDRGPLHDQRESLRREGSLEYAKILKADDRCEFSIPGMKMGRRMVTIEHRDGLSHRNGKSQASRTLIWPFRPHYSIGVDEMKVDLGRPKSAPLRAESSTREVGVPVAAAETMGDTEQPPSYRPRLVRVGGCGHAGSPYFLFPRYTFPRYVQSEGSTERCRIWPVPLGPAGFTARVG